MPRYEYVCAKCDLRFELVRPMSQAGEGASCPQCHSNARRVFSTFGSQIKDMSELPSSWRKT